MAGLLIAGVVGGIASGLSYIGTERINNRKEKPDVLAIEIVVGAAFNMLAFGTSGGKINGGSVFRNGGSLKNIAKTIGSNMINNSSNMLMQNTTRTVAGKIVSKSVAGVRKNIVKNVCIAVAESAVFLGTTFYVQKSIAYYYLGETLFEE